MLKRMNCKHSFVNELKLFLNELTLFLFVIMVVVLCGILLNTNDYKLVSPTLVNNNSNEFIKDVSAAVQVNDCTSEINNDTDIKKIKKKNDDDDLFYIGIFWF
jgi:hypothetical protein